MPSQVTVTSMKTGPGVTLTRTFLDVTDLLFDFDQKTITVTTRDGINTVVDIDGATTITDTISSKQHTFAVS